ncbi:helix-turn-helix domain-containing protein [Patescibacteria group bacterium]
MNQFKSSKINLEKERLGDQLRQTREEREIKLRDAAQRTNINQKYLKALEGGRLDKLPAGIYGRNFLKEYSIFLGLDPDKLVELYNKETDEQKDNRKHDPFSKKVLGAQYFLTIPRVIKNLFIIFVLIICVLYLGFYLNNIISPPELVVISPEDNLVTRERHINVNGYTKAETEVIINEEIVLIDEKGYFSKELNLKNGLNTIIIEAKKKYSRTNIVIRKVLVNGE